MSSPMLRYCEKHRENYFTICLRCQEYETVCKNTKALTKRKPMKKKTKSKLIPLAVTIPIGHLTIFEFMQLKKAILKITKHEIKLVITEKESK